MLGAIVGDVIGAPYEWNNIKWTDFDLFTPLSTFTDDTILTLATANSILNDISYESSYRRLGETHPGRGYGGRFQQWLRNPQMGPYNSWGNGSAMRVSPVGWAYDTETKVMAEARRSAEVTHDHPEGVKGAQATALAVFMARSGASMSDIRKEMSTTFGYDMDRSLEEIRPGYEFDVSCQGTVPEAMIAFLESNDFEDAIRKAVSLGGDSDTLTCITGSVAHAFYGEIPTEIAAQVKDLLSRDLVVIMNRFCEKFVNKP
ncbi:MAG: ADP-ribosylglycohydrolase family protein [Candidatus Krumholzibacteria bacterium]|nr:ADP-ribosylglycohydrolase family protein [Candidatus Krumholzibacteria bacterium]